MSQEQLQSDLDELNGADFDAGTSDRRSIAGKERLEKPGYYHFSVLNLTVQRDSDKRMTGVRLSLIVLGGSDPTQIGTKLEHFLNFKKKGGEDVSDNMKKQNARFVRAAGLATAEEILQGKKPNWNRAIGAQFFGKVAVNDGRAQIDYGQVWAIGDESALEIPANFDALAEAGIDIPAGQVQSAEYQDDGSSDVASEDSSVPF